MNISGIKHLIFDLGGVIIDLDTHATFKAFENLTGRPVHEWKTDSQVGSLLMDYEKGLVTDQEFRDNIRTISGADVKDSEIDHAWNAMLGAIPSKRIEFARELGNRYSTFVLSNTNAIHVDAFNKILEKETGQPTLDPFFNRVYFSHLMKMRKPETEIYERVLEENNLAPEETLFMDDNPENLKGAEKLKIQTFLVPSPDSWLELF